jgi:FtsZ-binding cell division protein ZapB
MSDPCDDAFDDETACYAPTNLGASHVQTEKCGFDRNASHSAGRYVCTCGWSDDHAAPEQPTVTFRDRIWELPENALNRPQQSEVWSRPPIVLGPKGEDDGLVDREKQYVECEHGRFSSRICEICHAVGPLERTITALQAEVAELRENGQRLMEAADGWKEAAQHFQQERNELEREVVELKRQLDEQEGYPGIIHDFEECKRQLAETTLLNDSHKMRIAQAEERAESERDALRRDEERLNWLEAQHTLHKSVEFLYVVDGYDCILMYDSNPKQEFHGDTLRAAIDAAAKEQP